MKGKTKPVRIFTLLGDHLLKNNPLFQRLGHLHERMLESYRGQKWDETEELMKECLEVGILKDTLTRLYGVYAARIQNYLVNPPTAGWGGVYVAETK